jgi:hypothetical protein
MRPWGGWPAARARRAAGGEPRRDGAPRTLGGVFFRVARAALRDDPARLRAVFPRAKGSGRGWAAQLPPGPPWAARAGLLAGAPAGKVTSVKITLTGRPEGAVERREYTVLRLTHRGPLPPLPKGLPLPPQPPATTYTVYIAARQWRRVAQALAQPDDLLVVEGVPVYDAERGELAVFASSVTTRAMQRAGRRRDGGPQGAPGF